MPEKDKIKKVPRQFQRALWSYDIDKMNFKEDKREIITQVLNYGNWEDLKLLYKLYSEKEIKNVIKNPRRGVWFEKVLNFWTTIFEIKLPKKVWDKAIMNIYP
ncbi:MAG: hypothetical protein COY73_02120 [Candidatus Nealsonbacteria bacterium CG_4_10_14_0_8_um_filter_37_14]|uniref:DUF6922 domain-containing protein n=1 Tax=Candidatus Nealsonbacteria bacterium CG_4_10_14_0_8_um_filter_37_14 TaxID=1974684 RepID=A0A2M7R706_9BACT|nr:MAG: hypothetical protein COZ89_00075 [Candidatus Nealsonbacteria bacterium CG_4_8_14_3_um_filter_37_23]PIY89025.1 MAG: hypothetical protein COY73_02120 [Candidatus Nealsonbacteria bacterium CG_4_10_14_0_8_um_filter_37_14]